MYITSGPKILTHNLV